MERALLTATLVPGLSWLKRLVAHMSDIFLVIPLLPEIYLAFAENIYHHGNEKGHPLELVVLALELGIVPGNLIILHLEVKELGLEVLRFQLPARLGLTPWGEHGFFHITIIIGFLPFIRCDFAISRSRHLTG